jgi:hypothetical protein
VTNDKINPKIDLPDDICHTCGKKGHRKLSSHCKLTKPNEAGLAAYAIWRAKISQKRTSVNAISFVNEIRD